MKHPGIQRPNNLSSGSYLVTLVVGISCRFNAMPAHCRGVAVQPKEVSGSLDVLLLLFGEHWQTGLGEALLQTLVTDLPLHDIGIVAIL